jgi:hypothetical protein
MMNSTKLPAEASTDLVVTSVVLGARALGILIIGVLLLIAGCGPPI